jgi:hypothetical protein
MNRSLVSFTAQAIAAPPMATRPAATPRAPRPSWLRNAFARLRREARRTPVWRAATGPAR